MRPYSVKQQGSYSTDHLYRDSIQDLHRDPIKWDAIQSTPVHCIRGIIDTWSSALLPAVTSKCELDNFPFFRQKQFCAFVHLYWSFVHSNSQLNDNMICVQWKLRTVRSINIWETTVKNARLPNLSVSANTAVLLVTQEYLVTGPTKTRCIFRLTPPAPIRASPPVPRCATTTRTLTTPSEQTQPCLEDRATPLDWWTPS